MGVLGGRTMSPTPPKKGSGLPPAGKPAANEWSDVWYTENDNMTNANWNDVWYSEDGRTWEQLKTKTVWKQRHALSCYVLHDKLWVAAGHARPLANDVWSLELPLNWPNEKR